MIHPSRQLLWKSSLRKEAFEELLALQDRLRDFYSSNQAYYEAIRFANNVWKDPSQLEAQDILRHASSAESVLEVGCGSAHILDAGVIEARRYTGIDFSQALIAANRARHEEACFYCVDNAARFPVESGSFDFVFSHYVLEHCVFPATFLDECTRSVRSGGRVAMLCPDYLGTGTLTSQRVGYSDGTGREKLRHRLWWDAAMTALDSRWRIPLKQFLFRIATRVEPKFYVNMAPRCFTDRFAPDVDAVYLTCEWEIRRYLSRLLAWDPLPQAVRNYSRAHGHIYLRGEKVLRDDNHVD
jgi:SAM-dependent methyltransferase